MRYTRVVGAALNATGWDRAGGTVSNAGEPLEEGRNPNVEGKIMAKFQNPQLQREPALQPFSRDHYQGLVQARKAIRAAEQDAAARREAVASFLDAWRQEIADHFADEERLLIELMNEPDVRRLRDEHATLRRFAGEAETKAGDADPDPAWLRRLGETLEAHIRWEERELFPRIEQHATGEQLQLLKSHTDQIEAARPRNACHRPQE